jgi:SAM-dependent methyltransferase
MHYRLEQYRHRASNNRFQQDHPTVKLPPDYLMYESFQLDYAKYFRGGRETAEWVLELLTGHLDLQAARILDWGCGPARVVRHLPHLIDGRPDIHGTDYNARSIAWAKANIADVRFNHNGLEASLPYPDGYFDGVYGISIITHLSEEGTRNWVQELTRVLRPGGLLLLTAQGANFGEKMTESERTRFAAGRPVVRGSVREGHRVYSAFHPESFLRELFHRVEIVSHIVRPQDGKGYIPQDTWIVRRPDHR